jgi:transcriptional regulator with XRE-family HTH domain
MVKNNLKTQRLIKGFTQAKLAKESGISERQLQRIEKGEQDPSISTVHKLTFALGVTIQELFPLPGEANEPQTTPKW